MSEDMERLARAGQEEWRPFPEDRRYFVSSIGRVRGPKGGILKTHLNPSGYQIAQLSNSGGYRIRNIAVHRLVLLTFVGPCPVGMEGCHTDGQKLNNRASNLRWDTKASNYADMRKHGSWAAGSRAGNVKLNEAQVSEIKRRSRNGDTRRAMANDYSVTVDAIKLIVTGKNWKHVP